jgi:hypothetical protein
MKLVKKILNRLNGLHYTQEYLCIAREIFKEPLHVYVVEEGKPVKDITCSHLFTGYCPLVFAFASATIPSEKISLEIVFSKDVLPTNALIKKEKIIASLSLKKIAQQTIEDEQLFYYEGIAGSHHFLSHFHQRVILLNNRLYNRKPGNVFLDDNLYTQVQIAYSIPRKISLITVGQANLYNHFPTDLHGQVNDNFYVISLRHEGQACRQVEFAKKIVLSDMEPTSYKQVYALGKNHMQPLKEKAAFDFDLNVSKFFHLPLPKNLTYYKELELQESFIHGIHRFFLFKIIYAEKISPEPQTLAHIHNVYDTWRYKKNMESNYLMR